MANALYPKWKQALLQGTSTALLNGSGTTGVYASLVQNTYTYNAANEFYTAVQSHLSGPEVEITGKTFVDGKFDGNNIIFVSVTGTATIKGLILYVKNAGANTTWRLVAYMDSGITGLPFVTDASDVSVSWSANGIFAL